MNAAAFDDGASFCDGARWWRRLLVFYGPVTTRPRKGWVDGLCVGAHERPPSIGRKLALGPRFDVTIEREPVEINARYVQIAKPCGFGNWSDGTKDGEPGYLLYRAGRNPVAWVPAAAWLEATKP